jgi:hypothetical protein
MFHIDLVDSSAQFERCSVKKFLTTLSMPLSPNDIDDDAVDKVLQSIKNQYDLSLHKLYYMTDDKSRETLISKMDEIKFVDYFKKISPITKQKNIELNVSLLKYIADVVINNRPIDFENVIYSPVMYRKKND